MMLYPEITISLLWNFKAFEFVEINQIDLQESVFHYMSLLIVKPN